MYVFILKSITSNAESGSESEDSNHNKNMVKTTTAIVEPKRKLSKRISKTNMKIEKSSPKQTNSNINQIEEFSKKSKQILFIVVVTLDFGNLRLKVTTTLVFKILMPKS